MVLEMWREGRGNTLVKVYPKGTLPNALRAVGYCTSLKYVAGRTPDEMEAILGFKSGTKLQNGADVFRVEPLPTVDQFELRGHSQTPAGVPQINGQIVDARYPPGLGVPQWELSGYPQSGLKQLASVAPGQKFVCRFDDLPANVAFFMSTRQRN